MTRRARGAVLRLVRRRRRSALLGVALAVPSGWVEFSGGDFAWWAQGLALIGGAVGIALIWTGLAGLGPDWIDEATARVETDQEGKNGTSWSEDSDR